MDDGLIGLPRGTLALRPWTPAWAEAYAAERALLLAHLADWFVDVAHVGSTSVPGLEAKPLIDLQAGLRALDDAARVIPRLTELGYTFMPERVYGDFVFLPKGPEALRTHHLTLVEHGSAEWHVRLRFRDALRASPELRIRYRDLKRRLATEHAGDRPAYTDGKGEFVAEVLAQHP
ncbi:GrpB family protein [Nocardioides dongkuii]|uniref:GrpB family protein n=1 Tax=Nocardioides dongkuii TaxID=2760089 RepID=UPI0015F82F23|nr:GrpB family protein [Nocardioides dongkuii]